MQSHQSFPLRCGGRGGVLVAYRVSGGGSPNAVASNADDGSLVNVASADEAWQIVSSSCVRSAWCLNCDYRYLVSTYAFETVSTLMPKASAKGGFLRRVGGDSHYLATTFCCLDCVGDAVRVMQNATSCCMNFLGSNS